MGWGDPVQPSPATVLRQLIEAVDRVLASPTTSNWEALIEARARADRHMAERIGW